ncbi:MAG: ankyrin repeat domain-containing protein [Myxococcaceae bacterium]|nr:ankyrin repeat domain-containing protein [Myxococcaceae bacterium]
MSLFDAVDANDLAALKAAVKSGADLNEVREGNQTPLIAAAKAGHLELVRVLLDAGAEPQWKDDDQETALLKAAANGHRAVCVLLVDESPPDEQELAKSFLAAYGKAHGPEYAGPSNFAKGVAKAGANASAFLGNDDPLKRLERVERAESNAKKRR